MKFIRDSENDLINLDKMERIFIYDKSSDYPFRFEVIAQGQLNQYTLKKYKTEEGAKKYLKKIYESSKLEIGE